MRKQITKKSSASTNFSLVGNEAESTQLCFVSNILKKKKHEKKESISRGVRSSLMSPKNNLKKVKNKQNFYQTVFNSQKTSPISTPIEFEPRKNYGKEDYRFIYQVGSGGFGKVWKVQNRKDHSILAMKEISKAK